MTDTHSNTSMPELREQCQCRRPEPVGAFRVTCRKCNKWIGGMGEPAPKREHWDENTKYVTVDLSFGQDVMNCLRTATDGSKADVQLMAIYRDLMSLIEQHTAQAVKEALEVKEFELAVDRERDEAYEEET